MMYFDDYEKVDKLLNIVDEWTGVKYFHQGYSKGGVDCTGYILNIFLELGIIKNIIKTKHSKDWYFHTPEERLLKEMDRYKVNYTIKEDGIEFGDLLLFSSSNHKNVHHLGLNLGCNLFTHCLVDIGVITSQLEPFWKKYLVKVLTLWP